MRIFYPHRSNQERAARPRPAQFAAPVSACLSIVLLWAVVGCHSTKAGQGLAGAGQQLDFNQDVQPILASNCFSCHGPDPEMRKAGLRLDLEESAFHKRPGHPDAIVRGNPEQSELIKRIEEASKFVPLENLALSPQCGFASVMEGNEMTEDQQWAKIKLVVDTARTVWH